MNRLYAGMPRTIFDVMSGLARERGAVNLGQGFPEEDGPSDLKEAVARATLDHSNQYPPMMGLPALREAVAAHYKRVQGVDLDWTREVTITSGATEAIAAAILAVLNPGEEAVLVEPMYDAYRPLVERAGGVARYVRLAPPDWRIPRDALAAAFTEKTRAIVLNSPVNPSASLLVREDLEMVAEECIARGVIAISDEVWEHVTFDGAAHVSILNIPGMRERAIKIGSAGKMFSMTGWKVGFICAAPALTDIVAKAHQFLTFTTPPNLQFGAAYGLAKGDDYFAAMRAGFQRSRDRMAQALRHEGFAILPCAGTYFLNIDLAASGVALAAEDFALRAVNEHGVASIPLTPFYASAPPAQMLRLCFAKRDDTLDRGVERLAAARRAYA
ncbi:MAG: aminotransferase [Alphaproteobacteria bacterium]|nr:aminotransferase [Alphaproteobacteria bacterium]